MSSRLVAPRHRFSCSTLRRDATAKVRKAVTDNRTERALRPGLQARRVRTARAPAPATGDETRPKPWSVHYTSYGRSQSADSLCPLARRAPGTRAPSATRRSRPDPALTWSSVLASRPPPRLRPARPPPGEAMGRPGCSPPPCEDTQGTRRTVHQHRWRMWPEGVRSPAGPTLVSIRCMRQATGFLGTETPEKPEPSIERGEQAAALRAKPPLSCVRAVSPSWQPEDLPDLRRDRG